MLNENGIKQIIINEFIENELYIFINEKNLNQLIKDLKTNLKEKYNDDEIIIDEIKTISKLINKQYIGGVTN